jgi:hypothetical protein
VLDCAHLHVAYRLWAASVIQDSASIRRMSATFFSLKVTKKGPTPYVPRPVELGQGSEVLQLGQACIPATVRCKTGSRISVYIKVGDDEEDDARVAMATLVVGQLDTVSLGLLLDEYAEFTIEGPDGAEVHITGYFNPMTGGDEVSEDEDDAMRKNPLFAQLLGQPSGYNEDEDEDEEEDSDDSGGESSEDDGDLDEKKVRSLKRRIEITDVTVRSSQPEPDDTSQHLYCVQCRSSVIAHHGRCAGRKSSSQACECDSQS